MCERDAQNHLCGSSRCRPDSDLQKLAQLDNFHFEGVLFIEAPEHLIGSKFFAASFFTYLDILATMLVVISQTRRCFVPFLPGLSHHQWNPSSTLISGGSCGTNFFYFILQKIKTNFLFTFLSASKQPRAWD